MNLRRFLFGVGAGFLTGYWLYQQTKVHPLKPEQIISQLKQAHDDTLPIIGSWIEVEPHLEQMDHIAIHTYQCGLTGLIDGSPKRFHYKVDAFTGDILSMQTEK